MSYTEVKIAEIPQCNFCPELAEYDGATTLGHWAYMCRRHFDSVGIGIGIGKGQKLVKKLA